MGNLPIKKERFTKSTRGDEISTKTSLSILVGILLGPEPFERGIEEISWATWSEVTGVRKIEFKSGWFKNEVKCLSQFGILDLIVSAAEEKKELKEFATRIGWEVVLSFILNDIGLGYCLV